MFRRFSNIPRCLWSSSFILLALLCTCLHPWSLSAKEPDRKRVLILHSYHPGFSWTKGVMAGMEEVLAEKSENIQLHVEYLDTKRYYNPKYSSAILGAILHYKLEKTSFDLVLLSDNNALNLALNHRADLFANTPIVFCGINNFKPAILSGFKGITGVAEFPAYRDTVELALRLHPATEEIVFIGNTRHLSGWENRKLVDSVMAKFGDRVRFTLWDNLPLEDLTERLERLKDGRLVFLNETVEDRSGQALSFTESIERIRQACPVPLYSFWDVGLGRGIVGGRLLSSGMQGSLAARLALRVLKGENPDDIPVISAGTHQFMFDFRELDRFGVSPQSLPEGSTVINRPPPFYELSKEQLWGGLALMTVFAAFLLLALLKLRKTEKSEKVREAQVKLLLDSTAEGIYGIDLEGNCTFCNSAALLLLGYEDEKDLLGKNMHELIHHTHANGSRYPGEECRIREVFRNGVGFHFDDEILCRADGSSFFAEYWAYPLHDGFRPSGAVVSFLDITERKRSEEALRESELRYRSFVENFQGIAFRVSPSFSPMFFHGAVKEITGYSEEDFTKEEPRWNQIVHPEDRPLFLERGKEFFSTPNFSQSWEYRIIRKDGQLRWVQENIQNVSDQTGRPMFYQGAIFDITDCKEAQERLRKANRELDAFVHTVSHDLRNPLTLIFGFTDLLRKNYGHRLDAEVLECLQEIRLSGESMLALIQDLLALAKVGHLERPPGPVDANDVVRETTLGLEDLIAGIGASVQVGDLPGLRVPRTLLGEVFGNLIANALRYGAEEGGTIEIGGERREDRVRYFVRDHGPGIPVEERDRIFEVFFRGSTGKEVLGTGVGLATVQKIARHFGGWAWVEDTPGGGATFWVELEDGRPPGETHQT